MRLLLLSAFLLACFCLPAQRVVRCLVLNHSYNPPRPENVAKLTPLSSGGNTLEQGRDGIFELRISGAKPGDRLELLVSKDGYRILGNDPTVFTYAVPADQGETVRIPIIKNSDFDSRKADYEKAIEKRIGEAKKVLLDSIARLQSAQIGADERTGLTRFIGQQNREIEELRKSKDELANRLAQVDLEEASDFARQALKKFRDEGDLKAALALMSEEKLDTFWDNVLAQEDKLRRARQQAVENYMIRARMLAADFQFSEAYKNYLEAVEKDSVNLVNLWEAAAFFAKQNQYQQAIYLFKKCQTLAKTDPDRAAILDNLGNLYSTNNRMYEAEKAHNEALGIHRKLAAQKSDEFLLDLAGTLINLGALYHKNQKMPEAEKAYREALNIQRQFAAKNSQAIWRDLARGLNNLGEFYSANRILPEAEKAYHEALSILLQLAAQNPDAFMPDLATTLNNFGEFSRVNQKMLEAEKAFNEALVIRRQLAAKNRDAFLPALAITLNSLGAFYHDRQKMPEAEMFYTEALGIFLQLAAQNPDAFMPDFAVTLSNLGEFFRVYQKMPEAEMFYTKALGILRQLAAQNPNAFLPDLGIILNNIGGFYQMLKEYPRALKYYNEALFLREKAVLTGQEHFLNEWFRLSNNIARLKEDAQSDKDFPTAVWASRLIAESCDTLRHIDPEIRDRAVWEYGSLSHWALRARDYPLAERAARRCLELAPERTWAHANLGHAHLLRGDIQKAKAAYLPLKGQKDSGGKDYKIVLEADFQALDAEDIRHEKGMAAIRKWLLEEW